VPTRNAPANASTPMLTGSKVAITKISPSSLAVVICVMCGLG
jgi:hypothetical protein